MRTVPSSLSVLYYITAKMTGGDKVGGKTSTASKAKYNAKAYDEIKVRVRKGEKERIKALAQSQGKTVNGFIYDLIRAEMKKEAGT